MTIDQMRPTIGTAYRRHDTGIKGVGPNCLGFVNFASTASVSFASGEMRVDPPRGPGIGIASQSGALGFALGQAERRGLPISHVLTFGNGADVHIADEIAYLAGDPGCAVIACLFEGMAHPLQVLEAGELAWRAGKAVVNISTTKTVGGGGNQFQQFLKNAPKNHPFREFFEQFDRFFGQPAKGREFAAEHGEQGRAFGVVGQAVIA